MPLTKKNPVPQSSELSPVAGTRCGLSVADLTQSFLDDLFRGLGRVPAVATRNDAYTALALTVGDRLLRQGVRTMEAYGDQNAPITEFAPAGGSWGAM